MSEGYGGHDVCLKLKFGRALEALVVMQVMFHICFLFSKKSTDAMTGPRLLGVLGDRLFLSSVLNLHCLELYDDAWFGIFLLPVVSNFAGDLESLTSFVSFRTNWGLT